jgi:hypothetical protein
VTVVGGGAGGVVAVCGADVAGAVWATTVGLADAGRFCPGCDPADAVDLVVDAAGLVVDDNADLLTGRCAAAVVVRWEFEVLALVVGGTAVVSGTAVVETAAVVVVLSAMRL